MYSVHLHIRFNCRFADERPNCGEFLIANGKLEIKDTR